jgi:hypothetical protein
VRLMEEQQEPQENIFLAFSISHYDLIGRKRDPYGESAFDLVSCRLGTMFTWPLMNSGWSGSIPKKGLRLQDISAGKLRW